MMKMKLLSAAFTLAVLTGGALAPAPALAVQGGAIGTTRPSPPVPAGYWQGWYSRYVVIWHGGLNTGTYEIQIPVTYITAPTQAECALTLSTAMGANRVYQWASCVQML